MHGGAQPSWNAKLVDKAVSVSLLIAFQLLLTADPMLWKHTIDHSVAYQRVTRTNTAKRWTASLDVQHFCKQQNKMVHMVHQEACGK
ncbi:hypothetical protein BGW80DRAFT_467793 [Lactifluus volemus]|nr:hypothetical protein BGW80DRAFT_467793 [Lactifluus volemus]